MALEANRREATNPKEATFCHHCEKLGNAESPSPACLTTRERLRTGRYPVAHAGGGIALRLFGSSVSTL